VTNPISAAAEAAIRIFFKLSLPPVESMLSIIDSSYARRSVGRRVFTSSVAHNKTEADAALFRDEIYSEQEHGRAREFVN